MPQTLDYASPDTRIHRRISGRTFLALGILCGAIPTALPSIFGPIHFSGRGGSAENLFAVLAGTMFVIATTAGIWRRIADDHDPSPKLRKFVAACAIVVTAAAFYRQFGGNTPRTWGDDARLIAAAVVNAVCCAPFAFKGSAHKDAGENVVAGRSSASRLRRLFSYLRHHLDIATISLVLLVACGSFVWRAADEWVRQQLYYRAARQWYAAAALHQFPAMSLQYSEDPNDGLPAPSNPGWQLPRNFIVDANIERQPFLGRIYPWPQRLFVHELTHPSGQRAIVTAEINGRMLDLGFWEWVNDSVSVVHTVRLPLEGVVFATAGELRIFSGQIDPEDSARFVIPFETRDLSGRLCVRWIGLLRPARVGEDVIEEGGQIAELRVETILKVR